MLVVVAIAVVVMANGVAGEIGLTPDCPTRCGNVSVPYPFGISPGCYLPGFNLTCDRTGDTPKLLIGNGDGTFQVTDISLPNGTVRVNTPGAIPITYVDANRTDGRGTWRGLIDGGPYYVAKWQNQFVLSGCNFVSELVSGGGGGGSIGGCSSFCPLNISYDNGSCAGIGCCQMRIPMGRAYYGVRLRRLDGPAVDPVNNARMPVVVFIAEKTWLEGSYSQLWRMMAPTTVPVVLRWAVGGVTWKTSAERLRPPNTKLKNATCSAADNMCRSRHSYCSNRTNYYLSGHVCNCQQGYDGNPYLIDGCQDINECEYPDVYKCYGNCINLPGTYQCRCPRGTRGNPYITDGCVRSSAGVSIAIGVGSSAGLLFLVLGVAFLTSKLKVRRQKKLRKKFFKQNRGQLLQQRTDIAEGMIITLEELEKATNNFDKARELGGGGHGTVYKGILSNLHVVAVKKSNIMVQTEINEFINEVTILSQINHRNVVKLFGCCLETEVPLLVYEFIPNGTLYHHLHVQEPRSLPWDDRLRIAIETSRALTYLHSAVSIPIIHRDIKSNNILLNDTLTAKVSDFGASRYIPIDQTGVITGVQGTLGYMDPVYYYTRRLTEKSDVYSFGVILIELLTGKKPFSYQSSGGDGLVAHFVALLTEDNLVDILDIQVMEEGDKEVKDVAALAATCVKLRGEDRPTMRQVEMTLEGLRVVPKGHVQHDKVAEDEKSEENHVVVNDPSVEARDMEVPSTVSRLYSLEEEFMWSARYPR